MPDARELISVASRIRTIVALHVELGALPLYLSWTRGKA